MDWFTRPRTGNKLKSRNRDKGTTNGGAHANAAMSEGDRYERIDKEVASEMWRDANGALKGLLKALGLDDSRSLSRSSQDGEEGKTPEHLDKLRSLVDEYCAAVELVLARQKEIMQLRTEQGEMSRIWIEKERAHEQAVSSLKSTHGRELASQITSHTTMVAEVQARLRHVEDTRKESLEQLTKEHTRQRRALEAEHTKQREGWEQHYRFKESEWQQHCQRKEHEYQVAVKELETAHNSEMEFHKNKAYEDKKAAAESLSALRKQKRNELYTLAEEHRKETEQRTKGFDAQVRDLEKEHEAGKRDMTAALADAKSKADGQILRLKSEMTKLQEQHDKALRVMREEAIAAAAQMKEAHLKEQQKLKDEAETLHLSLKRDIKSRNTALVAREAFKRLTDGELSAKFVELIHEVDALARLKWSINRSAWTDELQSQVSDAPRRLRKQVLQDTIWGILSENVFCSPFRMLGDEGRRLEAQWLEAFGDESSSGDDVYVWPKPSFGSERWRYETLRQCQEAVEKQISDYDPRQKLRKGYHQSLAHVQAELTRGLENVSSVDAATSKAVQTIAKKALDLWVVFGAQNCRLVVAIQGLEVTTDASKARQSMGRSVELMVRPELKRIGDAEGELWDVENIVAGCVGETVKILY